MSVLITGAGLGQDVGGAISFTPQFIHLVRLGSGPKDGNLIIDAKSNDAAFVREEWRDLLIGEDGGLDTGPTHPSRRKARSDVPSRRKKHSSPKRQHGLPHRVSARAMMGSRRNYTMSVCAFLCLNCRREPSHPSCRLRSKQPLCVLTQTQSILLDRRTSPNV